MIKYGSAVLVLALMISGCTPDKTLETILPRNALAVVLIDQPAVVLAALGPEADALPLTALDATKPWAAAAVPVNPPGFFLAVAVPNRSSAWSEVQTWAQKTGGLAVTRVGNYAILYSPGIPAPAVLAPDFRFQLGKVRVPGSLLSAYLNVHSLVADKDLTDGVRPWQTFLSWADKNLSGIRLSLSPRDGGLEVSLRTDWSPNSLLPKTISKWPVPADLSQWTGLLPDRNGLGVVVSVPPAALVSLSSLIQDASLRQRWLAMAPLIGPRIAMAATPQVNGAWSWGASIESRDPQAVRQALKTLVASGDLQRNFPAWALDGDTPVIYQDKTIGSAGVKAEVNLGPATVFVGYGSDRVAVAGGNGIEGLAPWERAPSAPVGWFREAPSGAGAVGQGSLVGLGARGAARVLGDGNLEAQIWTDGVGLKAWEQQLSHWTRGWAEVQQWFSGVR